MFQPLIDLWPIIAAIIMAIFGGGATIMVKRANRKAETAEERAQRAEDKMEQSEFREQMRAKNFERLERAMNEPVKKPTSDRSGFEDPHA